MYRRIKCRSCKRWVLEGLPDCPYCYARLAAATPRRVKRRYPGIGRLPYVLGSLITSAFYVGSTLTIAEPGPMLLLVIVYCAIVNYILTVGRLRNLGMSGWWFLLIFVPIVNLFLGLRCCAFPAGYADHGRLDLAAKVIAGIFLGLFAAFLLLILVGFASSLVSP